MTRPSVLRVLQHWFLFIALAVIAIACGGRSDEGLLPPDLDASLDGTSRGDGSVGRDGAGGADSSIGDDGGVIVLPDGAIVLPDGARIDGAGGGGTGPDGGTTRTLVRIVVDPAVASIGQATTQQLSVAGFYSDGSTPTDLTAQVNYTSSAPGVATVSTGGRVTAVAAGTTTITALKLPEMLTAEATITVTTATVLSITVTPVTATVGIGATVKFLATATMSDGMPRDVTAAVNWSSSDGAIASIAGTTSPTPGVATGIAAGMTTIRAAMPTGNISATATLTVTAAKLVSIAVTPPNPIRPIGLTVSFQAAGTYDDGVIRDVTNSVQWASSAAAVATIGATGTATTVAAGTTNITATLNQGGTPIVGTTNLTVTPARLASIEITPAMSTIILGGPTQQLVATGRYDNNTTLVITASVAWTSTAPATATVSNAPGSEGLVTGVAAGTAMITGSLNGITGTATVNVVAAKLVSIAITPAAPAVPKGATIPLTATGTYDTGTMLDVTTVVNWTVDSTTLASISNAAGSNGQVTGLALGMTQVHATSGAITAAVPLTITDAVPKAIEITPANPSIQVTRTQPMVATAIYTDGSTQNVTTQVAWTTGRAATATISNGAGSQGTVTAVAVGTTTVTATWAAYSLMGTTNITVTPAIPTSLTVTPFEVTIATNATQAYTAVVVYDIGTQATVTGQCMWTSSNTAVATIMLGGGQGGMTATARGLGGGDVTITCTYTAQGVTLTGTATLHVTPITTPVSLALTPDTASVPIGGTVQFVATVTLSNMQTQTVTNAVTWTSSDQAIAGITTLGNMGRGVATGLALGMVTITATYNNGGVTVTGTATLTVTGMPTGVTISPGNVSILVGQTQAYTTSVLFSDGSSQAIAANNTQMVCVSSDTAIATLQVMGNNRTGACMAQGTVTLTCTYTPVSGAPVVGTTPLECIEKIPTGIQVVPTTSTVALGQTVPYLATATFADGSTLNITTSAEATWSSSNMAVASVNNSGNMKGQAVTVGQGTVTITVTFRTISGTAMLTVGPVAPIGLSISPTGGTYSVGDTGQYEALLQMSDQTSTVVTNTVAWTASAPAADGGMPVATVTNTGAMRGLVTAVSAGSSRITATYTGAGGPFTDFVNITVNP